MFHNDDIIVIGLAILSGPLIATLTLPVLGWIYGYSFGRTHALSETYDKHNTKIGKRK